MSKQHEDDPFKGSVMTFGEHLNELRSCLWRAILGLGVGILLGFFLADDIVKFIQSPLEHALREYYRNVATEELHKINPNASQADVDRVEREGMVFERVFIDPQQLTEPTDKNTVRISPSARCQTISRRRRNVRVKRSARLASPCQRSTHAYKKP